MQNIFNSRLSNSDATFNWNSVLVKMETNPNFFETECADSIELLGATSSLISTLEDLQQICPINCFIFALNVKNIILGLAAILLRSPSSRSSAVTENPYRVSVHLWCIPSTKAVWPFGECWGRRPPRNGKCYKNTNISYCTIILLFS